MIVRQAGVSCRRQNTCVPSLLPSLPGSCFFPGKIFLTLRNRQQVNPGQLLSESALVEFEGVSLQLPVGMLS